MYVIATHSRVGAHALALTWSARTGTCIAGYVVVTHGLASVTEVRGG